MLLIIAMIGLVGFLSVCYTLYRFDVKGKTAIVSVPEKMFLYITISAFICFRIVSPIVCVQNIVQNADSYIVVWMVIGLMSIINSLNLFLKRKKLFREYIGGMYLSEVLWFAFYSLFC